MQEMREARQTWTWLAGWRATRDGSPRFMSYGRDEQEKGGDSETCSASMHRGDYEPEAALVEPGVAREGQKEGSSDDRGAPGSAGPIRVHEQQLERERERRDERIGLALHLDPVRQFLILHCLFVRSTKIGA